MGFELFFRFIECAWTYLSSAKKWGHLEQFEKASIFVTKKRLQFPSRKSSTAGSWFSSNMIFWNFVRMRNNLGRGSSNVFSQSRKYAEEQ
jgi:hypothetical protein